MKKDHFLPLLTGSARRAGLAAWQTGHLFRKLAARALDAVQEVLRTEVKKGNLKLVSDFLTDKALPAARALLLERMAVRLLARLGLRGALASNVVGWVLPFVVEHLIVVGRKSGFFARIRANATVAESLDWLDELRHAAWKRLVPDPGSSAEVLPDDNHPAPPPLAPHLPAGLPAPALPD